MSFEYIYERVLADGQYDIPLINNITAEIISFADFTTAEPALIPGNYYINTVTGLSSITSQSVTINYLYEAGESNWIEHIPEANERVYNESDSCVYFFSTDWGSAIPKNLSKSLEEYIVGKNFLLNWKMDVCKFIFEEELSSGEQAALTACVNTYKSYEA